MSKMIAEAVIFLILTLAGFTASVWLMQKSKTLKGVHIAVIWLTFCCACVSTGLLEIIIGGNDGFAENVRGICGLLSIVVLFIYAMWATALKVIPEEKSMRIFRRDSKLVWKIWFVPFALQIILGALSGK